MKKYGIDFCEVSQNEIKRMMMMHGEERMHELLCLEILHNILLRKEEIENMVGSNLIPNK